MASGSVNSVVSLLRDTWPEVIQFEWENYMRNYVLFALITFGSIHARVMADEAVPANLPTKVTYQRQVPREIRGKMRHGGQPIFYGVANWGPEKSAVAFHLYELKSIDKSRRVYGKGFLLPRCILDVFIARGTAKNRVFHRVNSVRLNSVHYSLVDFTHEDGLVTVGMSLLWLDSKQRTMPIVKIDTHSPALYPCWGSDILVVFPKGLSGNAVAQGFGRGFDNSSEGNSWASTFDQVDDRGLLVVHTVHGNNNETGYDKILRWNGKAFVPEPEKAK